jgi:hypothetical protein
MRGENSLKVTTLEQGLTQMTDERPTSNAEHRILKTLFALG